jgi:hypothetical protein
VDYSIPVSIRRSGDILYVDKLRGANKMAGDDPLSALVEQIVRTDPHIDRIEVDKRA